MQIDFKHGKRVHLMQESQRQIDCIKYWEKRIVKGWLGMFFIFNNINCILQISKHQDRLNAALRQGW